VIDGADVLPSPAGSAFAVGSRFFDLAVTNAPRGRVLSEIRALGPLAAASSRGRHALDGLEGTQRTLWKVNQEGESRRAVPKMKDDSPLSMAKNRCAREGSGSYACSYACSYA
jgi:hypothetical protein